MKKIFIISLLCTAPFVLDGCAPRIGGNHYSVRGAGEVSDTQHGVIVSVRTVTIGARTAERENDPGSGALLGGLAAGYGASQIGHGRGSVVAGGVGAIAGAVAGHFIERELTDQQGYEYQVRLQSGRMVTITQGTDPAMSVGQRVLVISSAKDRGRIIPDTTPGH